MFPYHQVAAIQNRSVTDRCPPPQAVPLSSPGPTCSDAVSPACVQQHQNGAKWGPSSFGGLSPTPTTAVWEEIHPNSLRAHVKTDVSTHSNLKQFNRSLGKPTNR